MIERIAKTEQLLSGKKFSYIPKSAIHDTKLLRSTITMATLLPSQHPRQDSTRRT